MRWSVSFLFALSVWASTPEGLPSDDVRCVAARGDRVWAGTAGGLAVLDGSRWRVIDRNHAVDACAADGSDVLWASGADVFRGTRRIASLPATAGRIRGLTRDRVAAEGGLFDMRGMRLVPGRFHAVSGTVAGGAAGLFVNGARELPRDGNRSWAPIEVHGVGTDERGQLWFFSPQGLGRKTPDGWRLFTDADGLPFDDATALAAGVEGDVWLGTTKGAIHFDGKTWEYRQGRRWLPDDNVRGVAVDARGGAWFATAKGVGHIGRNTMSLAQKAKFYEDEIDLRHRRTPYEYVMSVRLPVAGDKSKWEQTDSDNDGLWTGMYGAGECFAYGATKDLIAKRRATRAFRALAFLSEVTQGGSHPAPPGFPARAILPTSGPDPNLHDSPERDQKMQADRDRMWKSLAPRWPRSADGKWYWKTDTSSDELDGHYFLYALYYDLVAESDAEKEEVRAVVRRITDHLLAHNLTLVDHDGKPTRWGVFNPESLNSDPRWSTERGLNSLSILSYLKVAEHVTGDAKYGREYDRLIRDHHYATNALIAKVHTGPGTGNQSDDEMAMMNYYGLLKYETNPTLVRMYATSLAAYWSIERLERNPFFNFVAAASLTGKKSEDAFETLDLTPSGAWLQESVDTLRRIPLDRIDWAHHNSHRKDLRPGVVLPADERYFSFWNHNPYALDSGGSGHTLGDGSVFLLPYYMGRYHGYLKD